MGKFGVNIVNKNSQILKNKVFSFFSIFRCFEISGTYDILIIKKIIALH